MAVHRCEHADVLVGGELNPVHRVDIPLAQPVVFGKDGEGVGGVASRAAEQLFLGKIDLANVLRMAETAKEHGMPLLVRLGESQSYAVYHPGHRSIPASWAVVLCDVVPPDGASAARTSRRTTRKKSTQCKVLF